MNHYGSELSEMEPLLNYYDTLKFQNLFLDYGLVLLSEHNDKKLQETIFILDNIKEHLLNNPDSKVLKIKFQLKLSQLKSIISNRKRLELLYNDIKKLKHR
jgi:hypothetical protein